MYVYYGNASAADQQNKTAVWDGNFKGVYHFPNGTILTGADSTISGNNGVVQHAAATSGQIGGGASFNTATSDYVSIAGGGGLNNQSVFTIEGWVKWTGTQNPGCCNLGYGAITGRQKDYYNWSENLIALDGPTLRPRM